MLLRVAKQYRRPCRTCVAPAQSLRKRPPHDADVERVPSVPGTQVRLSYLASFRKYFTSKTDRDLPGVDRSDQWAWGIYMYK